MTDPSLLHEGALDAAGLARGAGGFALAGASVVLAGAAGPAPLRLGAAPNFALTTQQNARVWPTPPPRPDGGPDVRVHHLRRVPRHAPGVRDLARSVGAAAGRRLLRDGHGGPDPRHAGGARRFLQQGLDPYAWLLLTGTPAEIDVVTRRYEVTVRRSAAGIAHDCLAPDRPGRPDPRPLRPHRPPRLRTDLDGQA